jgi:maltose alpha-D-glucosyltransferase/alpha-amylase
VAAGQANRRLLETAPGSILTSISGPRGRGSVYDALASEDVVRQLLYMLRDGRSARGRRGTLRAQRAAAFGELYDSLDPQPAVQITGGEQSNTSVRIGGGLMMKIFRRLAPGPHPEVEAGRHFELVGFDRAPRLAGVFEYTPRDGEPTAAAVVHELVWNQGDGWTYTVSEISRFLGTVESMHEGEEDLLGTPFTETARVLAQRTAEMHLALAGEGGLEEFRPEPLLVDDVDIVADRIGRRLRAVVPALDQLAPELPEEDAAAIEVIRRASTSRRRWRPRLPRSKASLGLKIRPHGDYHLGQVLWARNDFYIVDFEGEVGLSLDERRSKASPLTDVAGMLRSFDYAGTFALREHAVAMPTTGALVAELQPEVARWTGDVSEAFLTTYRDITGTSGLFPEDPQLFDALLRLHLLDKALHELEYELANRPDWVSIPLHASAGLLQQSG